MYATLIYGEIISLTLESFFELGIAGWLNLSHQLHGLSGEWMGVINGYYCCIVFFFIFPALYVWLTTKSIKEINFHYYEKKWGGLYENL